MLDFHSHSARRHLVLRTLALHHDLAHGMRLGLHLNVAHAALPRIDESRRVAHARHLQQTVGAVGSNRERAIFVRHASRDECRVGAAEQHDIGERHWFRLLVDNPPVDTLRFRSHRHEAHH